MGSRFYPSAAKIAKIIEAHGDICYLCGVSIYDERITMISQRLRHISVKRYVCSVDHVVSVHDGGTSDIENLRPTHHICNMSKGYLSVEEFVWLAGLWSGLK